MQISYFVHKDITYTCKSDVFPDSKAHYVDQGGQRILRMTHLCESAKIIVALLKAHQPIIVTKGDVCSLCSTNSDSAFFTLLRVALCQHGIYKHLRHQKITSLFLDFGYSRILHWT